MRAMSQTAATDTTAEQPSNADRPSKAAWASLLAAWLGWVLDAFDFTVFLLVMPQIAKEFGVTITNTAFSITLTLLVRLLGGFVAGAAADRFGRKWPLMISVVWFSVCDGLIAFAPSFTAIMLLRVLFGFGMGAEWTSGATLAMEAWPKKSRGFASGVLQGGWAVGYLLAGAVSAYVLPHYGWRAMFVVAAVPALLALPIRFFVPESEEWQKNKHQRAAAAPKVTSREIRRVAFASFALMFGFAIYFSLVNFLPTLLQKEHGYDAGGVARNVVVFNVGMLVGTALCGYLATRVHPTMAIVASIAFVPFVAPLATGVMGSEHMVVGAFLTGTFAGGPAGVTPVWLSQIFPEWFRARGVGLVYHLASFGSAFVPLAVAAIAESGKGFSLTVAAAAGLLALGQVTVLVLGRRAIRAASEELTPQLG